MVTKLIWEGKGPHVRRAAPEPDDDPNVAVFTYGDSDEGGRVAFRLILTPIRA